MKYSSIKELEIIEDNLINYNKKIFKLIFKYISKHDINILDFGSGIGTFANLFKKYNKIFPDCFEICETQKNILTKRNLKLINNFNDKKEYDFIYSLNVIEHIEDDERTLKNLILNLKLSGVIFIFVPAMKMLYSNFDRHFNHHKRYDKFFFTKFANENNLEIIDLKYFDSVGFFINFFHKILKIDMIKNFNSRNLKFYDNFLFKLNYIGDFLFSNLFGKNIYFVARKKI